MKKQPKKKVRKNAIEWSVFAISVAIVLASVGTLVTMTAGSGDKEPDLITTTMAPRSTSAGFLVPLKVRNAGDRTAEEVRVVVSLEAGGGNVEQAELTIAFLPRKSEREGYVIFRRDPRCCRIEARATAFEQP